jgi:predicted RNA-binding Zn-ribbon protein involved in translation (DUF1610 family)/uncharacterized membrane protein YhaH (DUF805 family)
VDILSHPIFAGGDPTILGWLITLLYLVLSLQSYLKLKKQPSHVEDTRFWWVLLLFFLVLGINKQLDLQTDVLALLKHFASDAGLQSKKTFLKVSFVSLFACLLAIFLWMTKRSLTSSVKKHKVVWLGIVLLLLFVFARVVIFNKLLDNDKQLLAEHLSALSELFALLIIAYGIMRDYVAKDEAPLMHAAPHSKLYFTADVQHAACPQCGTLTIAKVIDGRKFKCKQCAFVFTVHITAQS